MPIIVPIEENHEGVGGLTDKKFKAADYSGSGLEVLGKGLATLGDGGAQFAAALDDKKRQRALAAAAAIAAAKLDESHQHNLDDAAAKNAYVQYSDKAASLLHEDGGLLSQSGVNAHAVFPATVAALADAHDQALAPLDPAPRSVVAPILADRLNGDVDLAAKHVHEQGAVEQRLQSLKLQQAAARDAVLNADDPDLHDHHMMTGVNAIYQQGKINGQNNKDTERQIADYKSGIHADTIDALTARAVDWYAKFGSNLNETDRNQVEATVGAAPASDQAVTNIGTNDSDASADAQGAEQATQPLQASNAASTVVPAARGSTTQEESNGRNAAATDPTAANETSQIGPDVVVRARVASRQDKGTPRPVAPKAKPRAPAPAPAKPERGAELAAQWAYDQKGSTEYREYGFDQRVGGTRSWIAGYGAPKCNFFVYDALAKGGIPQTSVNGQRRIALAGDWGNRNSDITGFRPLRVDGNGHRLEPVMKGDVVSNGGHVGIVVGVPYKGRAQYIVASAADPDHDDMVTLTAFGFRPADNPRNEKFKIVIWRHVPR